ncbi:DUF7117 family protein [Halorussus amylolyticus]|uniref:DUF7117 family protein n=1 Tax=Halorussus amylolyticus TaxID=1126242 RepID=UPI00104916EE|nr:TFIIB-type zinc ribbon-containing protein [Halorussus amylolyticus]
MKVRGERECNDCGTRWSYYETGSVECPSCGSLRSVGVDSERRLHTDSPVELDLTDAREAVEAESLREVADRASEAARGYVRKRGFVRGGDLRALDDAYLAANELRHAADVVGRGLDVNDDEEWYFLALLRGADDGERPAPSEVPKTMHAIRGLAYGEAVGEYRREMADWADEEGVDSEGASALETLETHVKRVRALEGDVDPETAELLVEAARDVSRFLREDDVDALASARERFDRLA